MAHILEHIRMPAHQPEPLAHVGLGHQVMEDRIKKNLVRYERFNP